MTIPATAHTAIGQMSPHVKLSGLKNEYKSAWEKWMTGKMPETVASQSGALPKGMKMSDMNNSGRIEKFTTAGAASSLGMKLTIAIPRQQKHSAPTAPVTRK